MLQCVSAWLVDIGVSTADRFLQTACSLATCWFSSREPLEVETFLFRKLLTIAAPPQA